jgi:hypothetical protein
MYEVEQTQHIRGCTRQSKRSTGDIRVTASWVNPNSRLDSRHAGDTCCRAVVLHDSVCVLELPHDGVSHEQLDSVRGIGSYLALAALGSGEHERVHGRVHAHQAHHAIELDSRQFTHAQL